MMAAFCATGNRFVNTIHTNRELGLLPVAGVTILMIMQKTGLSYGTLWKLIHGELHMFKF